MRKEWLRANLISSIFTFKSNAKKVFNKQNATNLLNYIKNQIIYQKFLKSKIDKLIQNYILLKLKTKNKIIQNIIILLVSSVPLITSLLIKGIIKSFVQIFSRNIFLNFLIEIFIKFIIYKLFCYIINIYMDCAEWERLNIVQARGSRAFQESWAKTWAKIDWGSSEPASRRITRKTAIKNSKGEIRTLDLTGMSRALSPAELPCHIHMIKLSLTFVDSFYFCIKVFK